MNEKSRNLLIRTASGAVLLAVVLGFTLASVQTYLLLILGITIGAMNEFYRLAKATGSYPQQITGTVAGVLLVLLSAVAFTDAFGHETFAFFLYGALFGLALLFGILILEIFRNRPNPIGNIATTLLGVLYVALPMALLLIIPSISDVSSEGWNPWSVLCVIFIVWANDIFAYLTGITLGRHRMCERISPKKSWEGFVGGILGAIGTALLCGHLLGGNLVLWGVIGVIAALSSVAGDLIESLFKRSAGVKESGNILPGHGGCLDRFDALILASPFVFLCFILYAIYL